MSEVQKCVDALVGAITWDVKSKILGVLGEVKGPAVEVAPPKPEQNDTIRAASKKLQRGLDKKVVAAKFLMHVRGNPGLRAEQVMEAIGCSRESRKLMPHIREILGKEIKTKGQRRGTTYWVKGA